MIRRPPRSTQSRSSAASDVYKRQPSSRRSVAMAFFAIVVLATLWSAVGPASGATTPDGTDGAAPGRFVDVVEVSGYLDRIELDFLYESLDRAESEGAEAMVIQLDSGGVLVSQADLDALISRIAGAAAPAMRLI